jgi:hypothetical protein
MAPHSPIVVTLGKFTMAPSLLLSAITMRLFGQVIVQDCALTFSRERDNVTTSERIISGFIITEMQTGYQNFIILYGSVWNIFPLACFWNSNRVHGSYTDPKKLL